MTAQAIKAKCRRLSCAPRRNIGRKIRIDCVRAFVLGWARALKRAGDEKELESLMREEVKSVTPDKETKGAAQDRKLGEELRAIEPDVYWGAVLERDARFDGLFV